MTVYVFIMHLTHVQSYTIYMVYMHIHKTAASTAQLGFVEFIFYTIIFTYKPSYIQPSEFTVSGNRKTEDPFDIQ